jgi:hypothetical membrane protein
MINENEILDFNFQTKKNDTIQNIAILCLKVCLLGFLLESIMIFDSYRFDSNHYSGLICIISPYNIIYDNIMCVFILTGILSSIILSIKTRKNKKTLKRKLLLIAPFFQLIFFFMIIYYAQNKLL